MVTSGTNAIMEGHQAITEHFLPRSDLVIFVTSVDRPFSDSEREFLKQIVEWKKRILIVINKIDSLPSFDFTQVSQINLIRVIF